MIRGYSRSKLVKYIIDSLNSGSDSSKLASGVAAYLTDAGKTADLNSLMRDAQELRATQTGIVELEARSAHKIEPEQVSQIEAVARSHYSDVKAVKLHQISDESVVAGVNLVFPHANFDLTVRSKLNQLREGIINT